MLYNKGDYCHTGMMDPEMMPTMPTEYEQAGHYGGFERGCGCGCECCMHTCCNSPACPIMDPPVEKCIKRDVFHDVCHICPINTKIINNHIFRHTYDPRYTCCEENMVTNIDPGCCSHF